MTSTSRALRVLPPPTPSLAQRAAAQQADARALALEAVNEGMEQIATAFSTCEALATLQPLPAGLRQEFERMADMLRVRSSSIASLYQRALDA